MRSHRSRRLAAIALAGVAVGTAWLALTAAAPGAWVATWAPCPRNWGWVPAWVPRRSPLESLSWSLGDTRVKVCYGSPALRGRVMLGGPAVPFGRLWRTGANEPTTIHASGPLEFGPLRLDPGAYALYSIPGRDAWTVVVNRSTRQWGLESEYTPAIAATEVGRFTVPAIDRPQSVENLRFTWEPIADPAPTRHQGRLVLSWDKAAVAIELRAPVAVGD